MASAKRDQLIDTAIELFNRDGYRATGIDKILVESGVYKSTCFVKFHFTLAGEGVNGQY